MVDELKTAPGDTGSTPVQSEYPPHGALGRGGCVTQYLCHRYGRQQRVSEKSHEALHSLPYHHLRQ